MGWMRFVVPRPRLAASALERAYFSGMDDLPWQSRSAWQEGQLIVRRNESDSGQFHVPWPVDGYGELMLATATLMEREAPYLLPVELARGSVHRLRQHLAALQAAGLVVSDQVLAPLALAHSALSRAVTHQNQPADAEGYATAAISQALIAGDRLSREYTEAVQALRQKQAAKVTPLVGVSLGSTPVDPEIGKLLAETFNSAVVPLTWGEVEPHEGKRDWSTSDQQIQWCRDGGLRICGGRAGAD